MEIDDVISEYWHDVITGCWHDVMSDCWHDAISLNPMTDCHLKIFVSKIYL